MSEEIHQGERVRYYPTGAGNVSEGTVKRILTEPQAVGARPHVPASEDDPRIVIENLRTHKEAAYKLESIIGKIEESKPTPVRHNHNKNAKPEQDIEEGKVHHSNTEFNKGEHVKYHPTRRYGNVSEAIVKRVLRKSEEISGHKHVHASEKDP